MKGNYLVFDTETGGFDPNENPVIQFGAVILDKNTLKELDYLEVYIKPYDNLVISQQALDVALVTLADLAQAPDNKSSVKTISKFIATNTGRGKFGKLTCVGHNLPFDLAFMNQLFASAGKNFNSLVANNNNIAYQVDTMQMARRLIEVKEGESGKTELGFVCNKLKIDLLGAHGALSDARATADVFRVLSNTKIDGYNGGVKHSDFSHRKHFLI